MTADMGLRLQIERSYAAALEGMDIPWMLNEWAERTPDKVCLIWCPFDCEYQYLTYAQLFEQARCLAKGLNARGVKPNDFVILHMDNSPEFIVSWYACAILGAVAVSTNTRSVARDLKFFAEVTEAVCCLTQPKFAELIKQACPDLSFVGVSDNDAGAHRNDATQVMSSVGAIAFGDLFGSQPIALRAPDPAHNLSIQFTSGTTSRPKAVLWTHGNGVWAAKTNAQHLRIRHEDVTSTSFPLFHTNAQSYSMLTTHWTGGTLVLQPRFSSSRYWQVILDHKVTWTTMIGFSLKAMASLPVPEHHLRFFLLGVRSQDVEAYFGVATIGYWGMTETVTQGTIADYDHLGPPMNIGRCAPEYQIQVRNSDGEICAPGERGRLFFRGVPGVTMFKEYYKNPEATATAFDENGWFDTGDVVNCDKNGWLYFSDRDKDMLKVGAENVAASEIETVIMQTGLAAELAVVGQKHHMLDEVPVVFVIPSDPTMDAATIEQQIIKHCEANLPDFKVVRSVHVVDELPRSTLEKIAKNVLREQLPPIEQEV